MDDVGAQSIRAEETPVAASAQSLVLAAVAAENAAFGDDFGGSLAAEECLEKIITFAEMSLTVPVDEAAARELFGAVSPGHFTPSLFVAYTK